MYFPGASISFGLHRCDGHSRFQGLEVLTTFGFSHVSAKLCKKDFRDRFSFPFSGFCMLPLFRVFTFLFKMTFKQWGPRGNNLIQGLQLRKGLGCKNPIIVQLNSLFTHSPRRSYATGMTS